MRCLINEQECFKDQIKHDLRIIERLQNHSGKNSSRHMSRPAKKIGNLKCCVISKLKKARYRVKNMPEEGNGKISKSFRHRRNNI